MRVLIADDHPMMVDGLRDLLDTYGFEVVGAVGNGQDAVSAALRLEPDLVLMDITMPVCNGLDATRLIKAQRPDMKIVMLTTSAENEDLFEAIKSGACGYLLKVTTGPAFIEALRGLEQGIPPFSPGLAELLLREFARLTERQGRGDRGKGREGEAEMQGREDVEKSGYGDTAKVKLTDRQAEVLRLVAAGLTYKQVGERLYLSEATVRYHMVEIMHLLHLENRNQVIAYAGELRSAGKLGFNL
jgi:DNA-binding NarL/FixJ family response regulator